MAETIPKSTEAPTSDWDVLREAYTPPETKAETSAEKSPAEQISELKDRIRSLEDQIALLVANSGKTEKTSEPNVRLTTATGEGIALSGSTPREHSPTESYVRDIMPGTVEIDDYKETHRAEMELIAQHRAEYQERADNAKDRKKERKLARGELREANKLERKDRNSARYDKAKVIGKKALRGVGRFLKRAAVGTGRALKTATIGDAPSPVGKHRA
jgi:hypothetical protein